MTGKPKKHQPRETDKVRDHCHLTGAYRVIGVYPYSWANGDPARFTVDKLPPIEIFKNDLTNEACSESDYKHAQNVWRAAGCKTFGDYHDLYLKLDVTLLADVFENFRDTSMATYGLDPAHFYTTPGFAWSLLELSLNCLPIQICILLVRRHCGVVCAQ